MAYRYIGNKGRIVTTILREIQQLTRQGSRVADLMCGTGAISEALKLAGYRVFASDLMTFSVCHAWVRLKLDKAPDFKHCPGSSYMGTLEHLNGLPGTPNYYAREYAPSGRPIAGSPPRKYLSDRNAAKLDAIVHCIRSWHKGGRLDTDELNLLRHDLVMAVNHVANIAGTYGHFRSSWSSGSLRELHLTDSTFLSGFRTDHHVRQGRAEDIAKEVECSLCYIDPPYMKRQYAANYHLIETVARMDEPAPVGISGLRPWRDQYSDFCSKQKIWNAFRSIFTNAKTSRFLISYSEDGLITKPELMKFFGEFGTVSVKSFNNSRFRSNNSPLGRGVEEYLFLIDR